MLSTDVVVVAAGASRRMGGADKLTVPLAGRPLLAWTLEALAASPVVRQLVVVAAPERVAELQDRPWLAGLGARARVVAGGPRRQESVFAGVAASDAELVLVHDGARPLVTPGLVSRVAEAATLHGAAIPTLPVGETLKRLAGSRVEGTVPREGLATAQTPQGARRDLLERAFAAVDPAGSGEFTDEAALLEAAGVEVVSVEGESTNIKVTRPQDLELAEALLIARLGPARVGHGADSHPFGPGEELRLGGLTIPEAPPLAGHSDGDVALHAVADALLGAAALGDLGRLFPAGDPATRGIDSRELLRAVVASLLEAGWRASSLDLSIVAARPRLGSARLQAIREAVAELTGLEPDAVGTKASTGNLDGPEGEGRSISATAIATVVRTWPSG
jgi:2-C-methyl-D-erythritol 4-phosphate cytidylyltransferase/2-C-methyl-D-erythritol 2,4-cyclodiphosphate synthase